MAGSDTIRIWHQDISEGVQIRAEDFNPAVHRKHGEPVSEAAAASAVAPVDPSTDDDEG